MAKKSTPIEEPIEEVAVEATELTAEVVNPLANGYPSRDFFSPIAGVSEGKAVATVVPTEEVIPSEDGGQEEA
jgi:hypothetical protein